jgi:hypothetical protein
LTSALHKEIKFSQPGIYHILVFGNVPSDLLDYFEGEVEEVTQHSNGNVEVSLIIHVRDQAELTGLINMIYNFRLVLLSVKVDGLI